MPDQATAPPEADGASGTSFALVPMVGPDGTRRMIPTDRVASFERAGARRATAAEYQAAQAQRGQRAPGPAGPQGQGMDLQGLAAANGGRLPEGLVSQFAAEQARERMAQEGMTARAALEKNREDAAARRTGVPATADTFKNYPQFRKMGFQEGDVIPQSVFDAQTKPAGGGKGGRGGAAAEAQWTQLFRLTNPTDAMRGSPLGLAAVANQRANRALEVLNAKDMSPQRKTLAVIDLAGIMQGGTPHEQEIATTNFGTLGDRAAMLKQQLSGDPARINQPEIKQEIVELVKEVKRVDNRIIRDNLDQAEDFFADRIKEKPEQWRKYKTSVLKSLGDEKGTDKGGKAPHEMSDQELLDALQR